MDEELNFSDAIEDLLQSEEEYEASRMQKEQDLLNLLSSDTFDGQEEDLNGSETNDEEE